MKVSYTTESGRLQFELEATTPKEAFAAIADIQELFEESACGKCGSRSIRFQVRDNDGHKYHEYVCLDCRAKLDVGQNKDMRNLYIKRRDKESKTALPNRGWYHWQADAVSEQSAPAPVAKPAAVTDLASLPAFLVGRPTADALNGVLPSLSGLHNGDKRTAWKLIRDYATAAGIAYDDGGKRFEGVA